MDVRRVLTTGNTAYAPGDGRRDFWFPDGAESAGTGTGDFAFGSGAWLMEPTTISAAMSAADALLINTRIAIVCESIFQIEGAFYTRRQEECYHRASE